MICYIMTFNSDNFLTFYSPLVATQILNFHGNERPTRTFQSYNENLCFRFDLCGTPILIA